MQTPLHKKCNVVISSRAVLGKRTLHHPHDNKQQFTRSLSKVKIPQNIKHVTIRPHGSVHEYGGRIIMTALPRKEEIFLTSETTKRSN
ncbi:MAG TPA: hypothetical protein VJ974_01570 [Geopsychrobacteraceae bacterium]|nr:hypothetical protein [Geopsychrobacteraceae bacterium]